VLSLGNDSYYCYILSTIVTIVKKQTIETIVTSLLFQTIDEKMFLTIVGQNK